MKKTKHRIYWSQDGYELHLCYGIPARGWEGRTTFGYLKYDHEKREWSSVLTFGHPAKPIKRAAESKAEAKERLLASARERLYAATEELFAALLEINRNR